MSHPTTQNHHEAAYLSLTKGSRESDLRGPYVPSDSLSIGDHAFPLAMNSKGQASMAASSYGSGRIVVSGHEGYSTAFPASVENASIWSRGDGSASPSVAVHNSVKAVSDNLSRSSFQVEVVGGFSSGLQCGVYVTNAYSVGADPKDLVAFLKAGGGVSIAGQAWSWAADHPKENTLHHFDGNKVSGVAGIYFSKNPGEVEHLPVYPQIPSSWKAVVVGKDFEDDLQFLLHGVSELAIPNGSLASEVSVHGPSAFPIGTAGGGPAFSAAAYYGQGRVIVAGHEGVSSAEANAPFWKNALHWLDEGRKGVVGVASKHGIKIATDSGLKIEKTGLKKDSSVFVTSSNPKEHWEEIQSFVAEGGGSSMGGHVWYWAQKQRGKNPSTDHGGNKLSNQMGSSLSKSTIRAGSFPAPDPSKPIKDSYHFRHLSHQFAKHVTVEEKLSKHDEDFLKKSGSDCSTYLHMKAHDCCHYSQVVATLTDILKKSGSPQVSEKCPVKSPKDHSLLNIGAEVYKVCPNPDALLPYLIKNNPSLPVVYNHRIKIDVKTAGGEEWISTGLYLSPGMKTFVSLPKEIVEKGWQIQIGCQTDRSKAEVLKRAPCVHVRFPVSSEMTQVWNSWGGLIYLVAPPKTEAEGLEVVVQMAVPAPYYKSGVTTEAEWSLSRTAPSPWAELEFDNIILTVPSEAVRNSEHPDELAVLWNDIMKAIADSAAKPHKFPRKERFVTDVQISHGWMHAGYPVMAQKASAAALVSVNHVKTKGIWGAIHESGHNQQRGCWEFPSHTTECTCNSWSVYVHETVFGINREKAHSAMTSAKRNKRAKDYIQGGRKLSSWSVWVASETYMQLQEKFGWDAFKKVFAAYHKMNNFPKDNKGKMNSYAETFSQTVGMDSTGFFKAWGWPIEQATEQKVSSSSAWTDHPMV